MFWLWWLWMALTAGVMITSHITKARGDKWPSRALLVMRQAPLHAAGFYVVFGTLVIQGFTLRPYSMRLSALGPNNKLHVCPRYRA
jgi:hypothetical protein